MELRGFSRQVPRVMALPRQKPRLWPRFFRWQTPSYQPWQPTENRGNCRGNFHGHPRPLPRQRGNHHGSPRKSTALPRQFPWTFNRSNFHGHPRPSASICHGDPPIRGDFHGSTWESAAIATACAAVLPVANSVVPIMLTAVRARGRESCRGFCRGCFRGIILGCPRTFPQTSPWVFP